MTRSEHGRRFESLRRWYRDVDSDVMVGYSEDRGLTVVPEKAFIAWIQNSMDIQWS